MNFEGEGKGVALWWIEGRVVRIVVWRLCGISVVLYVWMMFCIECLTSRLGGHENNPRHRE